MWDSDLVSCRGLAIGLVLSRAASLIFPIVQDVFVCRVIEQFWRVYTHMCLILYFKYIYIYVYMYVYIISTCVYILGRYARTSGLVSTLSEVYLHTSFGQV